MEPDQTAHSQSVGLPALTRIRTPLLCCLLVALAFALYGRTARFGFVWDDHDILFIEPVVNRPLDLRAVFTQPVDRLYRPVRTLIHAAEFEAAGRAPAAYHTTGIALHALAAALFFLLAFGLAGRVNPAGGERNRLLALTAAALFAAHPSNAEAVSFIMGGRSDLLAAVFILASLLLYLRADGKPLGAAAALLMFALALGSKESAAVLPALIVCAHVTTRGRGPVRGFVFGVIPFFVLLFAYLALRFGVLDIESQAGGYHGGSLRNTLLTEVNVWAAYVRELLLPWKTCPIYAPRIQTAADAGTAARFAFLAALGAAAAVGMLKRRLWGFGLAWFFVALLPVSNVVPLGSLKSDRFLYLPSMGLLLAAADLVSGAFFAFPAGAVRRRAALLCAALGAAACLWFSVAATEAMKPWENEETLWRAACGCAPDSSGAWNNLGLVHRRAGRSDDAMGAFLNAARLNPGNPVVYNNLANLFGTAGDYARALGYLEKSAAVDPDNPDTWFLMALALAKQGRRDEALERLLRAKERFAADSVVQMQFDRVIQSIEEEAGERK